MLLASVTSLPELVTGISSVTYAGVPDIAIGNVIGACVFNMLILAILDSIYRPMPVLSKALQGNILSAGFGIFLLSTVAISLFLGNRIFPLGWIALYTPLLVLIYLFAMRLVYSYERRQVSVFIKEMAAKLKYEDISVKTAILKFSVNSVIVIIAAVFLPKVGEGIAESTGLGQTFVGSIFIAIVTTIPEVVVSIAAVRIGAIDLAMGNLAVYPAHNH